MTDAEIIFSSQTGTEDQRIDDIQIAVPKKLEECKQTSDAKDNIVKSKETSASKSQTPRFESNRLVQNPSPGCRNKLADVTQSEKGGRKDQQAIDEQSVTELVDS